MKQTVAVVVIVLLLLTVLVTPFISPHLTLYDTPSCPSILALRSTILNTLSPQNDTITLRSLLCLDYPSVLTSIASHTTTLIGNQIIMQSYNNSDNVTLQSVTLHDVQVKYEQLREMQKVVLGDSGSVTLGVTLMEQDDESSTLFPKLDNDLR